MADSRDILHLFERPTEPVFVPKGNDNSVFDVPSDYIVDRYRTLQADPSLANRFGGDRKIPVRQIAIPDVSLPLQLGRRDNFSLFVPLHRQMASRLIEVFMGMRNYQDFLSATVYCRDRVNPYMFMYAFSVALLHRKDTKNLPLPSPCEIFPEKYMDGGIFSKAREEGSIVPEGQRTPIEIPRDYTASDLDIEHRVAYWREDLGVNVHHWHWHLVFPFDGPRDIVNKDRRGEMFYYMHQQIMARYNVERFCNGLARTERLNDLRKPMKEGYFPKLDSLIASRVWAPRFANTMLSDVDREAEQIKFDLQDMERWRDRIYAAIHSGMIINDQGQTVDLTESTGIDVLGNILEASILSPNRNLYGDLHNLGHVAMGICHDPDHRNLETFGTVGDPATAMRDPIFYRWHAFIDDIFQEHKNTLPRYTTQQLDFSGVKVTGLELNSDGKPKNQFSTFWQQSDVDMSRGLDFSQRGSVLARYTHLQHTPFTYKITVENSGGNKMGTIRIFYAPKFDERGRPMFFRDQKHLFVELDKFVVNLKSGKNNITRKSTESAVTIPFERTFRNLDEARVPDGTTATEQFNACGCGWPQHMLVAKGSAEGFQCDLFVMVSNYENDKVEGAKTNQECAEASSYCGVRDSLFPDRRSMGYPFDRQPRTGVDYLNEFLTPNMRSINVSINFANRTVLRPGLKPIKRPGATGTTGNRRN